MSETGHLPTDVESSDPDPGAATLQPGALLPSFLPSLPLLGLSSPLVAPGASGPLDSPQQKPLSAARLCLMLEPHPILSTCLRTSSGSVVFSWERKKQEVSSKKRKIQERIKHTPRKIFLERKKTALYFRPGKKERLLLKRALKLSKRLRRRESSTCGKIGPVRDALESATDSPRCVAFLRSP